MINFKYRLTYVSLKLKNSGKNNYLCQSSNRISVFSPIEEVFQNRKSELLTLCKLRNINFKADALRLHFLYRFHIVYFHTISLRSIHTIPTFAFAMLLSLFVIQHDRLLLVHERNEQPSASSVSAFCSNKDEQLVLRGRHSHVFLMARLLQLTTEKP